MKFLLNLTADNAAFHDEDCIGETGGPNRVCECFAMRLELSTILRETAKRIAQDGLSGLFETIRDSNGNDVGRFALKPDSYKP